ncbi:MAG: VOC family protein [Candidatus Poribacteria bacterium]|nr:VOC family protein [Candidatus Poribacteria bacterium]MDE0505269.1 VOC family protein [Candidatus Poribacteria bacterium]
MTNETRLQGAAIIPALRYVDAPAAVDWLCAAFGFEKHLVVPGEDGGIAHAQLTFRNSMIMLGSAREGEYDDLLIQPADAGAVTQAPYVIVDDVDAHCAQARAAGAEIVMEPADQDYGGRLYTCRDIERHLWNFGSYDPWADSEG